MALAELVWVLASTMKYSRTAVAEVVEGLLESSDVLVDRPDVVRAAFEHFRKGRADFADFLIVRDNAAAGCEVTVTLDKKAAREPGFKLLSN